MQYYLPYIILKNTEPIKIKQIINNGITLDGAIFDYRWLSNEYREGLNSMIKDLKRQKENPIIIFDPRTDLFQIDSSLRISFDRNNEKKIRTSLKSIYKLANYNTLDEVEDDSNFEPSALSRKLNMIVKRYIQSLNILSLIPGENFYESTYIIPPYFVSKNSGDAWYKLTIDAINEALKYTEPDKILAPIAVDKNFLMKRTNIKKAIQDYTRMNVYGYIIFPFDIDENKESYEVLKNLTELTLKLKETGKKVIVNVAEFGNILIALGIDAISCGICTRKTPKQKTREISGISELGRTESQIYIPSIFTKLLEQKFKELFDVEPSIFDCQCPICSRYDNVLDMIEISGYGDFGVHYVYWKKEETKKYSRKPELLKEQLSKAINLLEKYNEEVRGKYFFTETNTGKTRLALSIDSSYLYSWLEILNTFSQSDSTNI